MREQDTPDYVLVGHVTQDLMPQGAFRVGGTATYSAITAARLGLRVGVLTSAAADYPFHLALRPPCGAVAENVVVHCIPSPFTTTFENIYHRGRRHQYVRHVATPLRMQDLPESWRGAPILHLGPVANEVVGGPWQTVKGCLLGITPQGWMRRWDENGRVSPADWREATTLAPHADALVLSIEDVGYDEARLRALTQLCPLVAVTAGKEDAILFWQGQSCNVPAFEAQEVDVTGAGDVFAAAFFVRLWEGAGPLEAARFAHAAASWAIEAPGIEGIPSRQMIEYRLRHG
ncbi:MAG: ribokinase [Chloroflexi bacterium]|nr:ribokinase [Chloroflexota bacterium]